MASITAGVWKTSGSTNRAFAPVGNIGTAGRSGWLSSNKLQVQRALRASSAEKPSPYEKGLQEQGQGDTDDRQCASDQGLCCRPASGNRADYQPCIGYEEDQRHHAPQDYRGHDPAAGIRTSWTRCFQYHAKRDQQGDKDHIDDVPAADERDPFLDAVHGNSSGCGTTAD